MITWSHLGQEHSAQWRSETIANAPQRVVVVDDTLKADVAYRLACDGTSLLWHGDFQNARLLLQAMARRVDAQRAKSLKPAKTSKVAKAAKAAEQASIDSTPTQPNPLAAMYYRHRQAQAQRARVLSSLLVVLEADYSIALRRAPDWQAACQQAWGAAQPNTKPSTADASANGRIVTPLRELLGIVGAFEWRKNGVEIAALAPTGNAKTSAKTDTSAPRIYPHYGVFSPVRGEYIAAVAQAPLPALATAADSIAWDIGTGTGVLAAVLARRGLPKILATDLDPRAIACARENVKQLGYSTQIQVQEADGFPSGRANLIVCNPPWLPGKPSSPLEHAVYDPDSRMLRGFIADLTKHLLPGGEGWLVLSDLAEHLGLRPREQLLGWIEAAGLQVLARHDVKPLHPKATDTTDPLHAARAAEITSVWRLAPLAPLEA